METANRQQDIRAPNQPYVDLTKDTDSETPCPRQTLQILTPDPEETTQQERREAQWAQDACEVGEADYIHRYYAVKLGLVNSVEKYMGLCEGQLVNDSLLDAAARVQIRRRWQGMQTREITTYLRSPIQGSCTPYSEALRTAARNTEAMFLIHSTTMHFNVVIALRQRNTLTLIWCDSMQFDGS